jgi:hypothetical protein
MMTKFEIVICSISLLLGIVIGFIFCTIYYRGSIHMLATKAIAECEMNLPRNQHCTIIGVIEEN